jgi:hypothetical protein
LTTEPARSVTATTLLSKEISAESLDPGRPWCHTMVVWLLLRRRQDQREQDWRQPQKQAREVACSQQPPCLGRSQTNNIIASTYQSLEEIGRAWNIFVLIRSATEKRKKQRIGRGEAPPRHLCRISCSLEPVDTNHTVQWYHPTERKLRTWLQRRAAAKPAPFDSAGATPAEPANT